jgi:hypothetical protein
MRVLGFSRQALTSCAAAAMLAGCGGSQPPIGVPGAMLQTSASAAHIDRDGSWMLPEAKRDDLLYVSTTFKTYVDSYPQGKLVGELAEGGFYLCTDKAGNIFLSQYTGGGDGILEYAHGGTTPIATIKTAGPPWGCSVDPVTGDLAVALPDVAGVYHGELAIYKHERGQPRVFSDESAIEYIFFCRYNASGDLFIDGTPSHQDSPYLAELPRGLKTITNLSLAGAFYPDSDIEWDGAYLAVADGFAGAVDRISVSGSSATIVSTVPLQHWRFHPAARQVWIYHNRLITSPGRHDAAAVWHYPEGGEPFRRLHPNFDDQQVEGTVVSFAPHR